VYIESPQTGELISVPIATAKVIRTFLIVETLDFLSFCLLPSALCLLPSAINLRQEPLLGFQQRTQTLDALESREIPYLNCSFRSSAKASIGSTVD
jgi:hypothetical protein